MMEDVPETEKVNSWILFIAFLNTLTLELRSFSAVIYSHLLLIFVILLFVLTKVIYFYAPLLIICKVMKETLYFEKVCCFL